MKQRFKSVRNGSRETDCGSLVVVSTKRHECAEMKALRAVTPGSMKSKSKSY